MTSQIIAADPGNARTLARHATEIRRLLVESKELVDHGDWLPWLSREFQWSDTTAERFRRVHKLSLKNGNLPNLEIPLSGLYLLAAPSTPEGAKQEVISRAEAGEPMTVNAVKEAVERAPTRIMTGKQVAKLVSRECRFRDDPPPYEGASAKKPHGRPPKLLEVGTFVQANLEHARYPGGGFCTTAIDTITDCSGHCERRADGHYDYSIYVSAVISGEHLKKVYNRPRLPMPTHFNITLLEDIEEFRRNEPGLPNPSAALERLAKMGLEAASKRKEETLLALLTRVFKELEDRLDGSPGGKPSPYMARIGGAMTEVERAIRLIKEEGD